MASETGPVLLAPAGSTGNNTHTSTARPDDAERIAYVFIVEAVGGTPTVTWKLQGSLSDPNVTDANAIWFDMPYVTDASDTLSQATRVATAVGGQVQWVANAPEQRFFRRYRLVTTANTNVTYRAELTSLDTE